MVQMFSFSIPAKVDFLHINGYHDFYLISRRNQTGLNEKIGTTFDKKK
jgi:hypothetical protein